MLGGPGADFLRALRFGASEMILPDRCSTSYDLASLFCGRRNTSDRWSGKIAKRNGTRPSALQSTFHFWRKSRRIASFLILSTWKIEEISQNCFVVDVVKSIDLSIYLSICKLENEAILRDLLSFRTWERQKRSNSARFLQCFQCPDILASLMNMCACHAKCMCTHSLQMSLACQRFWNCYKTSTFCSLLTRCTIPCACHAKNAIWTSKSAPYPLVFYTFDFEMCFAPQRHALFQHQLPKILRCWRVL